MATEFMHRITVNGVQYDLCPSSIAQLFATGAVTRHYGNKGQLMLSRYSSIIPVPRLAGTVNFCDVHGHPSNCP